MQAPSNELSATAIVREFLERLADEQKNGMGNEDLGIALPIIMDDPTFSYDPDVLRAADVKDVAGQVTRPLRDRLEAYLPEVNIIREESGRIGRRVKSRFHFVKIDPALLPQIPLDV